MEESPPPAPPMLVASDPLAPVSMPVNTPPDCTKVPPIGQDLSALDEYRLIPKILAPLVQTKPASVVIELGKTAGINESESFILPITIGAILFSRPVTILPETFPLKILSSSAVNSVKSKPPLISEITPSNSFK